MEPADSESYYRSLNLKQLDQQLVVKVCKLAGGTERAVDLVEYEDLVPGYIHEGL